MAAGDIKIFTIVENGVSLEVTAVDMGDGTTSFSIKCLSGSADVNALYWHDDVDDGSSWSVYDDTGNKADKSLNMNGTGEDWDGGVKLSSPGLGTDGTNKSTYLTAGETLDSFTLNVSWDDLDTLGVRATSVGEDMTSIKGVADEPVEVVCAGRTDTGVHASGQVAHFDTTSQRSERSWGHRRHGLVGV